MTMRPLLAALAILVAWTLLDFLLHRLLLAPLYDASPGLWRPFDEMNVALDLPASGGRAVGVSARRADALASDARWTARRPVAGSLAGSMPGPRQQPSRRWGPLPAHLRPGRFPEFDHGARAFSPPLSLAATRPGTRAAGWRTRILWLDRGFPVWICRL